MIDFLTRMTNQELALYLRTISDTEDNIENRLLLIVAAQRLAITTDIIAK